MPPLLRTAHLLLRPAHPEAPDTHAVRLEHRSTELLAARASLDPWHGDTGGEWELDWALHDHALPQAALDEALGVYVDWAFGALPGWRLVARCTESDPRTLASLTHLGFTYDQAIEHEGRPIQLHSLTRASWLHAQAPPKIDTERLTFRPFTEADRQALFAIYDNDHMRRLGGFGVFLSDPLIEDQLDQILRAYRRDGMGLWALLHKETGELLGAAGITRWRLEERREFLLGYGIAEAHWHHGYASEAARAAVAYAREVLQLPYVAALVHPQNTPSIAILRRLGMTPIREVEARDTLFLLYRDPPA